MFAEGLKDLSIGKTKLIAEELTGCCLSCREGSEGCEGWKVTDRGVTIMSKYLQHGPRLSYTTIKQGPVLGAGQWSPRGATWYQPCPYECVQK